MPQPVERDREFEALQERLCAPEAGRLRISNESLDFERQCSRWVLARRPRGWGAPPPTLPAVVDDPVRRRRGRRRNSPVLERDTARRPPRCSLTAWAADLCSADRHPPRPHAGPDPWWNMSGRWASAPSASPPCRWGSFRFMAAPMFHRRRSRVGPRSSWGTKDGGGEFTRAPRERPGCFAFPGRAWVT